MLEKDVETLRNEVSKWKLKMKNSVNEKYKELVILLDEMETLLEILLEYENEELKEIVDDEKEDNVIIDNKEETLEEFLTRIKSLGKMKMKKMKCWYAKIKNKL